MRILLVYLALITPLAFSQPTIDNHVHNNSTCLSVTSCATAAQAHTAGKLLLAIYQTSQAVSLTIVNTAGDTWTALPQYGNGGNGFTGAFYTRSTAGNAADVTTISSASSIGRLNVTVFQLTGTASNFPIDVSIGGVGASSTVLTTSAFTTRTANQIIFVTGLNASGSVFTAGTGYTLDDTSVDLDVGIEHKSVTSTQTGVTAQMSSNGTAAWPYQVVSVSTTDLPAPAWTLTKTHIGNFTQGDYGDNYTITVTNSGTATTDGTLVTMTETIPSQMGMLSMSGAGWSCNYTVCTRLDPLAASASYPAITVTVWVASTATSPKVNNASIAGGGAVGTTSTTDSTTINAGPSTITLTAAPNANWSCVALACTASQRAVGHPPFPLEIDVSGSGTITIGACSAGTACTLWASSTKICNTQPCNNVVTAPAAVFFIADEYNFHQTGTPGVYTASFPITGSGGGSGTVGMTLTSTALTAATFASPAAIVNCTTVGASTSMTPGDLPICAFDGARLYSAFTMPAAGVTYTDYNFGGIVKGLVAPTSAANRVMGADSVTTQVNSDNSLVITNNPAGGAIFATSTVTGADTYSGFDACDGALSWDPALPLVYYWMDQSSPRILTHTLGTACGSDTAIYTYPGIASGLTNGGDGGVNKLKYWCAYPEGTSTGYVVIVNLNTGAGYTAPFGGFVTSSNVRFCNLSKGVDTVSHKMYAWLATGLSGGEIYSLQFATDNITVTGSSLVDEGSVGQVENNFLPAFGVNVEDGPGCSAASSALNQACISAPHSDTFEGGDGQQYFVIPYGTSAGAQQGVQGGSFMGAAHFNVNPALATTDVEAGGGLVEAFLICFTNCGDYHMGCAAKAPVCIFGTDGDPGVNQYDITNAVTSGGNVNLTLAVAPDFITGANVQIHGIAGNGTSTGCVRANGAFNGVTVSGTTVTLPSVACDGSWVTPVLGGAGITNNIQPPADPGHQDELFLVDFTNIASKNSRVVRLAKSRSVNMTGGVGIGAAGNYYTQNHPVISMLGDLVVFQSNNRIPYSSGIYSIPTGFVSSHSTATGIFGPGSILR